MNTLAIIALGLTAWTGAATTLAPLIGRHLHRSHQ